MLTIGILGGGQLARMLALAAYPLGWRTICWDPSPEACASDVTIVLQGDYDNEDLFKTFVEQVDVITLENENIPISILEKLKAQKPVWPDTNAVSQAQDRLFEKRLFQSLHIPTAPFFPVNNKEELIEACKATKLPAVLKTRRFGYDGKGQYVIRQEEDIHKAWDILGHSELILEGWIDFEKEVSLIAARNTKGECVFYPLVENEHKNGILHISRSPIVETSLSDQAKSYMTTLLQQLRYVGILTVEFFVKNKTLLANEMAPRVHNSGHWTIEGSVTSQFLQHCRAITGMPLGNTDSRGYSILLNCVGQEPSLESVLSYPHVFYHSYHKEEKAQRKLGHITINSSVVQECETLLTALKKINPFSHNKGK